jgi:hypothetical protein
MNADRLRSGDAPSGGDEALARAFRALDDVAGAGDTCPGRDEICASAGGRGGGQDRAVLAHLAECGACAAAWRVARELGSRADATGAAEKGSSAGVPSGRARAIPVSTRVAALAAAAVLVAAVGLVLRGPVPARAPSADVRASGSEWIRTLVPEDEVLSRENCLLRWTPGPTGSTYDVRVMTESLDAVANGRGLESAELPVPAALLDKVPRHEKLVWQVTVHLPDGRRNDSRSFAHALR